MRICFPPATIHSGAGRAAVGLPRAAKAAFLPALVLGLFWAFGSPGAEVDRLYQEFLEPPRTNSLMPYWFWNAPMTAADTRRQIREMTRQGVYQAVVFPWDGMSIPFREGPSPDGRRGPARERPGIRYLSEEYWKQVGMALGIAREFGFTLNFTDEFDWPSGHAWVVPSDGPELSRVLQAHPELRMRRLEYAEETVEGPRRWTWKGAWQPALAVAAREDSAGRLDAGSCVALPVSDQPLAWEAPAGRWLVTGYRMVPAIGAHNTRVDLLNPDSTKYYLALVYEEYARRFPQHLGKTLRLTLADHEGTYAAPIAYTPRLWDEFRARKGYDLRRVLPLLVRQATDEPAGRRVRRDFMDVVSALYIQSFTGQVSDWCARHGLQHATSIYEEQLYIQAGEAGDMFSQWRAGSAVFIDALLERARMPLDFKEAVSVAHFDGKPLLVENQGLQGHDSFFSLEKARLGSNMCLLWGANYLIPYFDYAPSRIQWPPQWFLDQPLWPCFRHYSRLVNRAQMMNGRGAHVAPVLLYYPLETAFSHAEALLTNRPPPGLGWHNAMDHTENFYSALRLELARAGWDYHIADRAYLSRAAIQDGELKLRDESFRVLILPPMTDMDDGAARQVRRFVEAGGQILAIGELPDGLNPAGIRRFPARQHPPFMDQLDYTKYLSTPAGIREDLKPLLEALRAIEPPQAEVLDEDRDRIYFSHRCEGALDWYWAVNDTDRSRQVTARFRQAGAYEKWEPETGRRTTLRHRGAGTDVELDFEPCDGFFVVRHPGPPSAPEADPIAAEHVVATLSTDRWRFTPEAPSIEVPYAAIEGTSEPLWLAPEALSNRDWWLIGPFPHDDHAGFFHPCPPETEFRPEAGYAGAFGEVRWQWVHSPTYTVTLRDALKPKGGAMGVYYARAEVWSPAARRAKMRAAFADSLAAWWNGRRVFCEHRHTKWVLLRDCWAESAEIDLLAGWNTVLLKVGPSLEGATGFMFRITDDAGRTLRDLVYSRDRNGLTAAVVGRGFLTVSVPPGAWGLRVPSFRKPFRLLADARPLEAGPDYKVRLPDGTGTITFDVAADDTPESPVCFLPGSAAPFRLQSWTDSALANFSGSAWYETEFNLPAAVAGEKLVLDLGEVGLAAEVWLNGRNVGERVWKPFRFDISGAAHPGNNRLRLRVTNSNAGWLAQGGTIYPKGSWGLKYRTERDRLAKLRPNGLEGPVRVVSAGPK